jgi:hypothetical protein
LLRQKVSVTDHSVENGVALKNPEQEANQKLDD